MKRVNVKLLGNPTVTCDERDVKFSFKKAEALFYYICVNKRISREEAINIFWTDCDSTAAGKGLRDALYKIKKSVCSDIVLVSGKNRIELNEDLCQIDTSIFCSQNAMELYGGEFLRNFSVKNSYEFDIWIEEKKDEFRNTYVSAVFEAMDGFVHSQDICSIRKYGRILISNDPYNESIYRYLMKIYASWGYYNKPVQLYKQLEELLKKDLNVEPDGNTQHLMAEIMKMRSRCSEKMGIKYWLNNNVESSIWRAV